MIGPYQRTGQKYTFTPLLAHALVCMTFVKSVKTQVLSPCSISDIQEIFGIVS